MLLEIDSLLYCAYTIAVFDLLCAVLFAALSLAKICTHLSWLTIFASCFGLFWLTLILLLIFGIYMRNSELVLYWLIFSSVGIFIELCLIIYAFLRETTFQQGVSSNSLILCLGLIVETIFAFIVYQFYLVLSRCNHCGKTATPRAAPPLQRPPPKRYSRRKRQQEEAVFRSPTRTSCQSNRCSLLQTRGPSSSYTCGPVHSPNMRQKKYKKNQEYTPEY